MSTKALTDPRMLAPETADTQSSALLQRPMFPSVWWIAAAVLVAGFANFNYIWNQFFHRTPFLFDTAWYAHLVYRSSPVLKNPGPVQFDTIGPDFYATHFSPLLWVFSWPTYVLPVSPETWLAIIEGVKYALLALVVGLALRRLGAEFGNAGTASKISALTILFLAPFNGIALANIGYPHFESWFMVGALGFLLALFRSKVRLAAVLFGATLLLREDMGFHLCGLLIVATLARLVSRKTWDRELARWTVFAGISFAWSCGAIALMRWQFPGDDAFTRIYAGSPPWAHLNANELRHRLIAYFETRASFWLPLAVFAVWAFVQRRAWVLLGFLAFVPWVAVNSLARSQAAATLALYYSFPLGVALLWPLVAHFAFARPREPFVHPWLAVALVLSIVGFIPPYRKAPGFEWADLVFPKVGTRAPLQATAAALAAAAARGESVAIDDAVAALSPSSFTAKHLLWQGQEDVTLAGFFAKGRSQQAARETIFRLRLPYNYRVRNTGMVVVAARPLDWPDLELASDRPGSMSLMLSGENPNLSWNDASSPGSGTRVVAESPALYFSAGPATATFVLSLEPGDSTKHNEIVCEVVNGGESERLLASSGIFPAEVPPSSAEIERRLEFDVPYDQGSGVQLRVRAPPGSAGRIRDFVLITSPPEPQPSPAAPEIRVSQP